MPTVRDILARKGTTVHTIAASAPVLAAIRKMNEHHIGALVVMDEGRVAGIFTERDVLRRVLEHEVPPAGVTVGEVMSRHVLAIGPDTDIDDASRIMRDRRIRHLPVIEGGEARDRGEEQACDGQLMGMISIGDINACHASEQETTIYFLQEYIYGRV